MRRLATEDEVRRLIEEATAPLLAMIAQLESQLAAAKKDSSTSSKPPFSDIIKPPRTDEKPRGGRKKNRRPSGPKRHPRHKRTRFSPEQVDKPWCYEWDAASLSTEWVPLDGYQIIQQVELLPKLYEVTEHRARLYRNRVTGQVMAASLPPAIRQGGLISPRRSALIAYPKGACHMTYWVIQAFLRDVCQLNFSTGQLVKVIGKASGALLPRYEQLQAALPTSPVVNIDATGHPENGSNFGPGDSTCRVRLVSPGFISMTGGVRMSSMNSLESPLLA